LNNVVIGVGEHFLENSGKLLGDAADLFARNTGTIDLKKSSVYQIEKQMSYFCWFAENSLQLS